MSCLLSLYSLWLVGPCLVPLELHLGDLIPNRIRGPWEVFHEDSWFYGSLVFVGVITDIWANPSYVKVHLCHSIWFCVYRVYRWHWPQCSIAHYSSHSIAVSFFNFHISQGNSCFPMQNGPHGQKVNLGSNCRAWLEDSMPRGIFSIRASSG